MAASIRKIEYRDFGGDAQVPAQRRLYQDAFPEQKGEVVGTEPYYRWKFRGFPAAPPSYEYGAYDGNEIVGYYAAIPLRYRISGAERNCGMVCDVMTHPKFQGRGIFTGLGRYSLEQMKASGLDFVTGFPIRPAVLPGHLKVGWKIALDLPMYLRPLRSSAILKSKGVGFASPLVDPVLKVINFILSSKKKVDGYSSRIHSGNLFARESEIQIFLELFAKEIPNYLKKDVHFYEWRLNAPSFEYKSIELRKQGKCVGLAITRRTNLHKIPVLAILDMMLLHGFEKGLALLHSALASLAEECGAEAVVTMMSSNRATHYQLQRHFFLRTPFVFKLIINRLNPAFDEGGLLEKENWHLMWIDSDDL